MNIYPEVSQIDKLLKYLSFLVDKYHIDSEGNPEMRGFTGEKYEEHLFRVSERVAGCFLNEIHKKKAKAVGLGHDLLEKIVNENHYFRNSLINTIESYGAEGVIVSQGMQLVDFKFMMPDFLKRREIKLFVEEGHSDDNKKIIKDFNYSTLVSTLLGNFGTDYFVEGVNQRSLIYAVITKMVDQDDNLDLGKAFSKEHNKLIFEEKQNKGIFNKKNSLDEYLYDREKLFNYQTTRNAFRIYSSHNNFVNTIQENKSREIVAFQEFREIYLENRAHAREIVDLRGTDLEKSKFKKVEENFSELKIAA